MSRRRRRYARPKPEGTLPGEHQQQFLMTAADAAATVLARTERPLKLWELVTRMKRQGLWSTTASTPKVSVCAAIGRELALGPRSRIVRVGRGLYALAEPPVRAPGLKPAPRPRTDAPPRASDPASRSDCGDSTTPG